MPLTILLAAMAVAPPPAPITANVPPPPAGMMRRSFDQPVRREQDGPIITDIIEADARADGERLWSGPLRISSLTGASFTRTLRQAAAQGCEAIRSSLSVNDSLTLSIDPQRYGEANRYTVTVRWDRPGPQRDACQAARSSRSIGLTETIDLPPGSTRQVTGDGGLAVTLRRR